MSDLGDRYRRRADAFARLIEGVAPDRWSRPSPCEGWTARDVVAHVVDVSAQVLREQSGLADAPVAGALDDPAAAFRATRAVVEGVLDDPDTPPEVATHLDLSLGVDLPQHGWDLAKATGQDATVDPDEVELLWSTLTEHRKLWSWQRRNGWYGPPVPVPDGAPLHARVLGLLGRDPAWPHPPTGRFLLPGATW